MASALAGIVFLQAARAAAVNITGTSTGLTWSAASGPVAGYAVQVSRDAGAFVEEARVAGTSTRVAGRVGERLVVRVAAFDATGRMGASSVLSDPIVFTSAPPPFGQGGDPAADIDGNGVSDSLAFDTSNGTLAALLLRTDGTRVWQTLGAASTSGMRPVGFADVDADGHADVLWRDRLTGANEIWLLRGVNHSVIVLPGQSANWRVAAFRDFSGDGAADVLFHANATGASRLWTLSRSGRLGEQALDPAPAGAKLAAVADIDGDAHPDLLWQHSVSRGIEAWLLRGGVPVASLALPLAPVGGQVAGVGDFDADGIEDLAWLVATNASRTVRVWFMHGANPPQRGHVLSLLPGVQMRGVADVDSNGRDEIVLFESSGFVGYTVDPIAIVGASGGVRWPTRALPLGAAPSSARWRFLMLE